MRGDSRVIRALSEGEVRGYGPAVLAALVPGSGGKPAEAALSPVRFRVLAALFVVSGGAGLVDQVCFSKYLSYVVGATAYVMKLRRGDDPGRPAGEVW